MKSPSRLWRVFVVATLLFVLVSGAYPPGGVAAQDSSTPVAEPTEPATEVPTEPVTAEPTETATEVPAEAATEQPTETATAEPTEEATEKAGTGKPGSASTDEPSFSIAAVTAGDPVVLPGTTVAPGSQFTVSITLTRETTDYRAAVQMWATSVFRPVDSVPVVTDSTSTRCRTTQNGAVNGEDGDEVTGYCTFTWTFDVPGDAIPGDYTMRFHYFTGASAASLEEFDRYVTLTVAPSAPVVVEPVVSPGTTVRAGETFSVTTGLSTGTPQGGATRPYTVLSSYDAALGLTSASPVIVADDTAVCRRAGLLASFNTTTDTGTCRAIWTFETTPSTPPGVYELDFGYVTTGPGATYSRSVTITVEAPLAPPVIVEPVVAPSKTVHSGETFTITTGFSASGSSSSTAVVTRNAAPSGITFSGQAADLDSDGDVACEALVPTGTMSDVDGAGFCKFTWSYTVDANAAPGDYSLPFAYDIGGSTSTRTVTITVAPPPIIVIAPVVSPSTTLQRGQMFTLTAGLTINEAQIGNPRLSLIAGPDGWATGNLTPVASASDGATCSTASAAGSMTSDTGTCRFTWTFTVDTDAPIGPQDLSIAYKVGGTIDETRTVTITVPPPPYQILAPRLNPPTTPRPGDTFFVTTGITLNNPVGIAYVETGPTPAGLELVSAVPTGEEHNGATCAVAAGRGTITSATGGCRFTWEYRVVDGAAGGDYGLSFSYIIDSATETRGLTVSVPATTAVADPVVSPGKQVERGGSFTIAITIQRGPSDTLATIAFSSTTLPIRSLIPAVSSTNPSACAASTSLGTALSTTPCTFTWTFDVPSDAAIGDHGITFRYAFNHGGGDIETFNRTVTITVEQPPVFSEPVIVGNQPLIPGQTFVIKFTVTLDSNWRAAVSVKYPDTTVDNWLTDRTPAIDNTTGEIDCRNFPRIANMGVASGIGSCTLAWSLRVPANAGPGDYNLDFLYQYYFLHPIGSVTSQSKTVTVTVASPPPTFADPVVVETQPVLPGQTFHIQTTVTVNPGWEAVIAPGRRAANGNWFIPQIPNVVTSDAGLACVGYADEARVTVPRAAGSCTVSWEVTVPEGTAPGDYTLSFDDSYQLVSPTTGDVQELTKSVHVTVALPPPVFHDPVVNPNPVEQDSTFTVTLEVGLPGQVGSGDGYDGSVYFSTTAPFVLQSGSPTAQATGGAECATDADHGTFAPSPGTCTYTWTFRVPDDTPAGPYPITLAYHASPTGVPGVEVDRTTDVAVVVKERPGRLVMGFGTPQPSSVHPGEQFTVTYTIAIDRAFTPVSFPLVLEPRPARAPGAMGSGPGGISCQAGTFPLQFGYSGGGAASCTYTLVYTVPADFTGDTFPISIRPGTPTGALPTGQLNASLSVPVIAWPVTPTQTATATATATQSATATSTQTATPTNTPTATASPTQTATSTPTATVTNTPTPTATATTTATPTQTATTTVTATSTPTETPTQTATATATPTETATNTPTQTATVTASPTEPATSTPTQTATATVTPTQTATVTPTATATPAPRLRVTPTDVVRGQSVTVSVSGFGPTEQVRVRWLVGSTWQAVGTITTDANGAGQVTVIVPSTAAVGANKVRGDSPTHAAQTGAVMVSIPLPPEVRLETLRTTVGGRIGFEAVRFPANTTLSLTWRRPGGSTVDLGSVLTNGNGAATGSIVVPATEGGAGSRFTVVGGGASASVAVDVVARIVVRPGTVSRGQAVTVTLTGYAKGETVRIRWLVNGAWITVGTVTVSNTGGASVTVTVPANAPAGQNSVRGDGTVYRQQTNAVAVT